MVMKMRNIFQFKIALQGSKPRVYRTIHVEDNRTFYEFHHIIQISMGWLNYHLFQFKTPDYFISDPSFFDYKEILDSKKVKLNQMFFEEGEKIQYEYDFGDGWIHSIRLEKILPIKLNQTYPVCIRGKRNCPPEDCGGIWNYQNLIEVIVDKKHPDYKEVQEWLGDDFDPDEFNIKQINEELKDLEKFIQESMFEM